MPLLSHYVLHSVKYFTWHLVCICQCGYCSGLPQQTDKFTIVIAGCSNFLIQPQIVYNYGIAKGWLKLVSITNTTA